MLKIRGIIKNFVIGCIALLICFLLLFGMAWASLQTDYVQTRAVNLFATILSKTFKSNVSVGSVSLGFFNRLVLDDVRINSLHDEKIAYVKELSASLNTISFKKKTATIGRVYLDGARFDLRQYKNGNTNIDDWLSSSSQDTSQFKWTLTFNSLKVENAGFSFYRAGIVSDVGVFDYENTIVTNVNGLVDNIVLKNNSIEADVVDASFKERCGFILKSINGHCLVSNKTIKFENVILHTDKSEVYARAGSFDYDSFDSFSDFLTKVKMTCRIVKSHVSMADIACFTKELKGLNQMVDAKGFFKGTVSDFVVRNASITLLDSTRFDGNVEITGLPDIKNTYFFIEAKKLKTSMSDIASIPLYPFTEGTKIQIDPMLKKLGGIKYVGNFSGYLNDVVAFGKISTALGNVSSDILIKERKKDKELTLTGAFSTEKFNVGALLGPESKIGKTDMDVKINTIFDDKGYKSSELNGKITSIEFNKYLYVNISFDGIITPKAYDGKIAINDPNLDMKFAGKCDLSKALPVFDFKAQVGHLNFHRLNFFKGDSIADISFKLQTNLTGNKIENMNGFISVDSVLFENKKGQSYVDNARLDVINKGKYSDYTFVSDMVDVRFNGDFKISNLIKTIPQSVSHYLPSLVLKSNSSSIVDEDNIDFTIKVKELSELSKTILPQIKINKSVIIDGKYASKQHLFKLNTTISSVLIGTTRISNCVVDLHSERDRIVSKTNFDIPVFNVGFKNVTLNGEVKNDSILLLCHWNKNDSIEYSGSIKTLGVITKVPKSNKSKAIFTIAPNNVVVADSVWKMSKASITIDSTLAIRGFSFSNNKQKLVLEGVISKSPQDSICLGLTDFELKYFNKFIKDKSLGMQGRLSGYLSLFEIPNNFHFRSKIKATDFYFAGTDYGSLYANSEWDEDNKSVGINVFTERGIIKPIDLKGFFFPEDNIIDFTLDVNNANVNIVSIFVKDFFSDLKGFFNGQVRIQGKLSKPDMHGYIDIKKASLFVDYLNTRYNVSGRCNVLGQKVLFDNIQLFDAEGNPAIANGNLTFPNFTSLSYNVVVDCKNFIGLDTKSHNNPYFYGKAYATGVAKIYGDLNATQIDVSARSNQNTIINIPVNSQMTIENNSFLTFKTKNQKTKKKDDISSFEGITMNFDLDVTPDAEIQIILDEKVGDIIRSKGNGAILMNIDTKGKFNMYGTYEIFSGDYLFTMRNIINKKFIIESGSKLTWTGNAFEANADIVARYKLKTSLTNLMLLVDTNPDYKRRVPIECKITLADKILSPNIAFSVDMKDADEKAKEVFNNLSDDEKNKQFMSLLVLNSFFPRNTGFSQEQANSLSSTSTEVIANQLSNLASNINKDLNVGINYRFGSPTTKQNDELEIAISTELLKNRVIVNVNGYSAVGKSNTTTTTESNTLGGDVNVEVKLNKKGTLRAKGFNRSNSDNIEKKADNTQGIGLSYSQSFNSFKDLFIRKKRIKPIAEELKL